MAHQVKSQKARMSIFVFTPQIIPSNLLCGSVQGDTINRRINIGYFLGMLMSLLGEGSICIFNQMYIVYVTFSILKIINQDFEEICLLQTAWV